MSEEIVGLARKDGRLVALVSVATREQEEEPIRFELRERPVHGARDVLRSSLRRAVEAWAGLREADWEDPRVLSSALTVLIESVRVGDGGAGARLPAQSALCAPDAWRRLREALRANEARVVSLLRRAGHGPQVAALVHARDPYVAYHHRAPSEPGLAALPPRFAAFVLPLLRSRPWTAVRRALAVFWGLGLQRDDLLLALAARLLAHGQEHGLAWLERIAEEDPSRREALGRALLGTGALARDPKALPASVRDVLAGEDAESYGDRLTLVLQRVRDHGDLEHALTGIRIARAFVPEHRFAEGCGYLASPDPDVPEGARQDLWQTLDRLYGAIKEDGAPQFAIWLWDWSASTPTRAALLRRPSLAAWPAHTTYRVLRGLWWGTPAWTDEECVAMAERVLSRVPVSHQTKAVGLTFEVLRQARLDPGRLTAAVELIVRLARPPFPSGCGAYATAAILVAAAGTRADRLAHVPERSLLRLERALRADDTWFLRAGLESLGRASSGFMLDALSAHPEPLMSTARHLGILSSPRCMALLKRFRAHVVSQRRFARWPLERVCRTVEALVRRGLPNPIPRKLREHRAGGRKLSAGSLERHRQAIVRRLVPFRLALLARMTLEDLDRGLGTDLSSETDRHALEMLASVGLNRRLLRRVLRVPTADREEFLERHPANRAWLARHPRVDAVSWRTGLVQVADLPDGRRLRLEVEGDPLEVLRMGTRVGSCLSVGGCFSSSAIAVMADANKRVVFARDASGAFVARQLVAVAEDDRLVFFPVYPLRAGEPVEEAFERYDRALATALGLEIHSGEADYHVAEILGRDFCDDGAWRRLTVGA